MAHRYTAKTLGEIRKVQSLEIANERLYKEVAAELKTSPKQVEECVKVIGKFVADTIKKGAYETIHMPYFGKFRVKEKELQWRLHRKVAPILPNHIKPKEYDEDEII